MNINELIEDLERIRATHGNVDIFVNGEDDDVRVTEVFYDNIASNPEWHGVYIATDEWPHPVEY